MIYSKGLLLNFLKKTNIIFFLMTLSYSAIFAEKVEITSDSMSAKDIKKEVHLIGNVLIKNTKGWLKGDKVIVYFNENNETNKYQALGTVSFEFKQESGFYKGSADKVTYFPEKSEYVLTGKATVDDLLNKRHIDGESIILDMKTGHADVKGNRKKPVKFIFDMENTQ